MGAIAAEGGGFEGEGAHPLIDGHGGGNLAQRLAGGSALALAEFQFGESERHGGGGQARQVIAQATAGGVDVAAQSEGAHFEEEACVAVRAFEGGDFGAQFKEGVAVAAALGEAGAQAQSVEGVRVGRFVRVVEVVEEGEGVAVAAAVGEALREKEGERGVGGGEADEVRGGQTVAGKEVGERGCGALVSALQGQGPFGGGLRKGAHAFEGARGEGVGRGERGEEAHGLSGPGEGFGGASGVQGVGGGDASGELIGRVARDDLAEARAVDLGRGEEGGAVASEVVAGKGEARQAEGESDRGQGEGERRGHLAAVVAVGCAEGEERGGGQGRAEKFEAEVGEVVDRGGEDGDQRAPSQTIAVSAAASPPEGEGDADEEKRGGHDAQVGHPLKRQIFGVGEGSRAAGGGWDEAGEGRLKGALADAEAPVRLDERKCRGEERELGVGQAVERGQGGPFADEFLRGDVERAGQRCAESEEGEQATVAARVVARVGVEDAVVPEEERLADDKGDDPAAREAEEDGDGDGEVGQPPAKAPASLGGVEGAGAEREGAEGEEGGQVVGIAEGGEEGGRGLGVAEGAEEGARVGQGVSEADEGDGQGAQANSGVEKGATARGGGDLGGGDKGAEAAEQRDQGAGSGGRIERERAPGRVEAEGLKRRGEECVRRGRGEGDEAGRQRTELEGAGNRGGGQGEREERQDEAAPVEVSREGERGEGGAGEDKGDGHGPQARAAKGERTEKEREDEECLADLGEAVFPGDGGQEASGSAQAAKEGHRGVGRERRRPIRRQSARASRRPVFGAQASGRFRGSGAAGARSHAAGGRVPDDLVQLQAEARVEFGVEEPGHQIARFDFAKGGREDDGQATVELEALDDGAGPIEIGAAGDDDLQLVAGPERVQIDKARVLAAGAGGLQVDDAADRGGQMVERALAVGLDGDLEAAFDERLAERRQAGLQGRFAAGERHKARAPAKELLDDGLAAHEAAFVVGVARVAIAAAQITAGEADKEAGAAGVGRLALDALEDLVDAKGVHGARLVLTGREARRGVRTKKEGRRGKERKTRRPSNDLSGGR